MARPPLTAPILGDPSRSDADPYDLHSDLIREEPHYLRSEPLTAILRTDHFIAPASWAEFEFGPEPKRAQT